MKKIKIPSLFPVVLGIIIGSWVLHYFNQQSTRNLEEVGLGEQTSSYFAKDKEHLIHGSRLEKAQTNSIINGWEKRGKKDVILILGNSQTHGINQIQPKDISYNHLLYNKFQPNYDVLCWSFPNANLQEFLLTFEYLSTKLPVKILILPVFMDDLREDGIRPIFFAEILDNQFILSDTSKICEKINQELSNARQPTQESESFKALKMTVQEKSETQLNDWVSQHSKLWSERPKLRGELFLSLYKLRNTIFGITAQTKRKIIPIRYKNNIAALNKILQRTRIKEIKTLLYIPPIRTDVEIPYVKEDYKTFKKTIENISSEFSEVYFCSLETIVPGKFWGMKGSTNSSGKVEYDFMHFQYLGHELLFESLSEKISFLVR